MGKTVLFSPVGGTDPVSMNNCADGSLLHICRVYRPDMIYLYMSAEILKYHRQDNRYLYCLERLYQGFQKELNYSIIEREKLNDVQIYDYFYKDYTDIIRKIIGEMDQEDLLILNVSSGTPAMKSGLLVLATMGEYPCKAVQVVTPVKRMNEHTHKDYDVELAWELDEDNLPDFENRCHEVECPSLLYLKQKEVLKNLIRKCDYAAAREISEEISKYNKGIRGDLIDMALSRYHLNTAYASKVAEANNIDLFPVKSGNEQKLFEYALNLSIKAKKEDYVDFIRGLTPLIADLNEIILKRTCGIDVNNYTRVINGVRRWDKSKLNGTEVENTLLNKWPNFRYEAVYSVQLVTLIQSSSKASTEVKSFVDDFRAIEEKIRNMAAHEIVSITDEIIHKTTGYSSKQIIKLIKKAFHHIGYNYPEGYWDSYNNMNELICNLI